jgi:peptide/nickel transport system permease protein
MGIARRLRRARDTVRVHAAALGLGLWDLTVRGRRAAARRDSQWAIAARQFKRNRLALVGLAIIVLLYLVALLAPLIAPYDPIAQDDIARTGFLPPASRNWLGTDRFGRDVLSRIIYGSRISLSIGFIATAISITIGTLLGAAAGYFSGKVDTIIMRFTDMVLAFPRLVLLIMIVALFDASITVIILVLGLTQWPGTTRIVRGDVLSLREREFIHAAQALGMSRARIMMRHLIPNVLAPVIVTATLGIGNTIVMEAGLSFLGLGVQPPTPRGAAWSPRGKDSLLGAWWVATFPGSSSCWSCSRSTSWGTGCGMRSIRGSAHDEREHAEEHAERFGDLTTTECFHHRALRAHRGLCRARRASSCASLLSFVVNNGSRSSRARLHRARHTFVCC